MTEILIVEDNKELAQLISAFLLKEGFSCMHVINGEDALIWLQTHTPKVILLDIMLPGIDGFAFCQRVRRISRVPIFIMSAKSTKADQLIGFELGIDDFIEKPVDPDILCAKIKALFLRTKDENFKKNVIITKNIKIDLRARKVYLKGKLLDLNVKEYELLLLLIQNNGKTLHKEYLFNEIWGMDSLSENQTLTVHIKMLRSHIEDDPKNPKRIQTVWGVGYRYEEL